MLSNYAAALRMSLTISFDIEKDESRFPRQMRTTRSKGSLESIFSITSWFEDAFRVLQEEWRSFSG